MGVERLFREHAGFVASLLHRLGVPDADVQDAVQEVFTVVHRKGGFEPGRASPRSWLGAIAVRVASTQRRSLRRRREVFDVETDGLQGGEGAAPARVAEVRDSLRRVDRALDELDLKLRAVFVLFEIEGEDCQSIAQALEVPVGTVYSRLHAARKKFIEAHAALQPAEAGRGDALLARQASSAGGAR